MRLHVEDIYVAKQPNPGLFIITQAASSFGVSQRSFWPICLGASYSGFTHKRG